jgi:NAD(P)-dependent dehydrogenase (short-subunit alcohol dehydrogenase family)
MNQYDLRDRVVFITGGSRGLGLLMARAFGQEGARLAICARDANELKRAREDLQRQGTEIIAIQCDVTQRGQAVSAVEEVTRHYGRVDVLVNNAGVIEVGPLPVMTLDDFKRAMEIHFWAPLYTTMAVLPQMQKRRSGRIVNITSIGGKVSVPHLVPYCSSKFALVGFSEGLRAELLKYGIRVTTVCPGLMRTGSARNAEFKGQHRREFALFSLSAALPITSMSATRAAKQIVEACKRGEAEITLSIQAKLAALVHGVAPGITSDLLGAINYVLPNPGGIGENRSKGIESGSAIAPSILTRLNDKAAIENNEVAALSEGQVVVLQ